MKNSKQETHRQDQIGSDDVEAYDPETGEIIDAENAADDLYGAEGTQADGTIYLPKLTMATIRGNPERAKIADRAVKIALVTGIAGGEYLMPKMDDEQRLLDLGEDATEYKIFCALVAAVEPWGCVRFDNEGEPDAVFKSDYLFLPTKHVVTINRRRAINQVAIALELWAQPSSNVRGYSWFVRDLQKYDHAVSAIDRMLMRGVQMGRQLDSAGGMSGLLADLRATAAKQIPAS